MQVSVLEFNALIGWSIAEKCDPPIIFSTHPRTRVRLSAIDNQELDQRIQFLKPLVFFDYIKLQMSARCVFSDSEKIAGESLKLNFPAVTIRQAHERPEGIGDGALIMCGLNKNMVLESMDVVMAHAACGERSFRLVDDYAVDNVSRKVLRIILSYKDYINRTVWRMP